MKRDWRATKAESLIARQLALISQAKWPSGDFAEGMIELAYSQGDINEARRDELLARLQLAVINRRRQLRAPHLHLLQEPPPPPEDTDDA